MEDVLNQLRTELAGRALRAWWYAVPRALRPFLRDGRDVDEIGRRLYVAFIADGSIQGDSLRLRLTIRLLRANDAVAVWEERFDFAIGDMPAVARTTAERLSSALEAAISATPRT
jgi:TolB-like protein